MDENIIGAVRNKWRTPEKKDTFAESQRRKSMSISVGNNKLERTFKTGQARKIVWKIHGRGKVLIYSENFTIALCSCNLEYLRVSARSSGWIDKLKSACESLQSEEMAATAELWGK